MWEGENGASAEGLWTQITVSGLEMENASCPELFFNLKKKP